MLLIDSHCHLDFAVFDDDRDNVITKAKNAGVEQIIVPSIKLGNWQAVRELAYQESCLYPAYGLHPMFIDQHKVEDCFELRKFLINNRCIAVGECGLDFFLPKLDREKQITLFREQLKIAADMELPLIIHARKSLDVVLKYIRQFSSLSGVMHSYSGSLQQAEMCIKRGFKLGFGGPITYPRATKLRSLVKQLPLDCLLLESDAPDQPDIQHKGRRNEPGFLPEIAQTVAELKGCSIEDIAQATTRNAKDLFKI